MEELWEEIIEKKKQIARHIHTCDKQLHRHQQQLARMTEEYLSMKERENQRLFSQYSQPIFEEVYNPNRARLDLAARSRSERERYAEQREEQQNRLGHGLFSIGEDDEYFFGNKKRKSNSARKIKRRKSKRRSIRKTKRH